MRTYFLRPPRYLSFAFALLVFLLLSFIAASNPNAAQAVSSDTLILVKFKSTATSADIDAAIRGNGGQSARSLNQIRTRVINVPANARDRILAAFAKHPSVERAATAITLKKAGTPNDPAYAQQWTLPKIAWDQAYGTVAINGSSKIAILDTGVDAAHLDLSGRIAPGQSFTAGNPNTDPNGHGTMLAGIAAANVNNNTGMAGVAYSGASVMPVQVLQADGTGLDSDVVAGVLWAADNGAQVILMGFSSPDYSAALADALAYAWSKGIVLVAATGNDGSTAPTYPAGIPNVIGVAATDSNDNLGANSNTASASVAAPGVNIYTSLPGNKYGNTTGTSAASAHVAGLAALLSASGKNNTTTYNQIIGATDPVSGQSFGRINVAKALGVAVAPPATPTSAPTPTPGATPTYVIAVSGGSGSINLTTLGTAYTQNFNTLASSGTTNSITVINGWYLDETGIGAANNGQYAAGTGSSTTGDTYSFGVAGTNPVTDRALGGLLSGSLNPTIGAQFTNSTGGTITSLGISYTGEQWRAGVTNRNAADRLDFQFSTNAITVTSPSATWIDYDNLDFNSPNINTTLGALDGNAAGNRTPISFTITGLSIPNSSAFWIRWTDFNISGSDDGLAVDDFSLTPTGIPADAAPEVSSTFPVNGATDFPVNANLSVTFSEPVNVTSSWFTLVCSASGNVATTFSGGPTTFTLDPGISLTNGENCTLTVLANQVSDQDANDPPDNMAFNFTVGFTPFDICAAPYTPIYTIQGSGLFTPIPGTVTTKGVVVGDFEGTASASGFYIQDLTGDGNPATSDGIFVYTGSSNLVSVGQVVRVTGYARERFNQTTINGSNSDSAAVPATNIVQCGTGSLAPTDVTLPFANADFPERYEGMLVRFPQALVIAEYFNYDRFGEIVLAQPLAGESRPFTGTAIDAPGAPANARTLANALSRITLDDANSAQNPSVLRHPNGNPFSLANRFRGGDTVQNAIGVLGYDFSLYRIVPTGPADYTSVNPRPMTPEPVGGTIRVAGMNTLNFFVTADYPTGNPLDNKCGPAQNVECRGWDSDQVDEFTRQRTKLLAALSGLDADIIGLNELENTIGVEPLASIVAGLSGYAYINTGTIGTDAIKVGMIYRPAVVTPIGAFKTLTSAVDPRFIDTKSRPSLAQTFEVNATGARFTVVVNHFKSKGSACDDVGDPDLGDGQGNCSQTRRAAAEALVDWLATDPTGSGDPDFLIVGDLNSYAREDTITEIKAGSDDIADTNDDFVNLIAKYQGTYAYSYTFDGQAGYLDHALANKSLAAQVKGATEWHINSDEPDVLDYDTSFKPPSQDALFEPNAYRTSDHDAIVVGLVPNAPPTVNANGPYSVNEGASVTLNATGSDPNGDTLTYAWDLDNNGTFETPGQSVTFSAAGLDGPSAKTIKVQVTDSGGLTSVSQATVNIPNVAPTATFIATTPVNEGSPFALALTNPFDPSSADTAAGFTYAFDCGSGYGAFTGTNNASCSTNDNGTRSVRGQIRDKDGGVSEYTASVTVLNVPPTATFNASSPVNEGSPITLSLTNPSDPSSVDTTAGFTYAFDCGTGYGALSNSNSASCPTNDNGTRTVKGQIRDKDGGVTEYTAGVTITNVPPTANFANTSGTINEGQTATLAFSNQFDPSSVDTAAGFLYAYDCNGDGIFDVVDTPGAILSCAYQDNGTFNAKGRIKDKDGGYTDYQVQVTVLNVPPSVGAITAPVDPVAVNTQISASANFTDPGILDTHTAVWDWGDSSTSAGTVSEANGSGSVTGSHTYTQAGVYTVKVTVTDKDGGSGQSIFQYVVVYDPSAGFVTGGGWINSPAGAYRPNPALTGKANFGFVSKYQKGANVPTGNTQFYFHEASFDFHSTSYDWLVIAGAKAQYKGSGTINGSGDYAFMLTAIDGKVNGGGGVDKFRLKVWNKGTNAVIYDNQLNSPDDSDPTTVLGGGSIVIHK